MKKIIGIGGKKRTGKSTLTEKLRRAYAVKGKTVEEISFAEPIKNALQEIFRYEVPWSTFVDDTRKQDKIEIYPGTFMTVRELLQKVGTECFRNNIHPDFWIGRGMAKIDASTADVVIISDVRFENELALLNTVGTTIYIERPSLDMPEDLHPSEKELDSIKQDFHRIFINDEDSLEAVEKFAKELVAKL